MKLFLVLGLALSTAFGTSPVQVPEKVVEYNLAGCRSHGFGVYHAEIGGGKFAITWHLVAPGQIEKYSAEDGIALDYTAEPVDKDGDVKFHSKTNIDGHALEMNGVIHGKYLIGVGLNDGDLTIAFYGKEGGTDVMADEHTGPDDPDYKSCIDLQGRPAEQVPAQLRDWLHSQDSTKGGTSASR